MSQYLRRTITMRNRPSLDEADEGPFGAPGRILEPKTPRLVAYASHTPPASICLVQTPSPLACAAELTNRPNGRSPFVWCWAAKPGSRRLRVGWRCVVASWPSDHHTARREKTCTSSDHCNAPCLSTHGSTTACLSARQNRTGFCSPNHRRMPTPSPPTWSCPLVSVGHWNHTPNASPLPPPGRTPRARVRGVAGRKNPAPGAEGLRQ